MKVKGQQPNFLNSVGRLCQPSEMAMQELQEFQ